MFAGRVRGAERSARQREIDWTTAKVRSGALRVRLRGRKSKGWARRLERVVELLDRPETRGDPDPRSRFSFDSGEIRKRPAVICRRTSLVIEGLIGPDSGWYRRETSIASATSGTAVQFGIAHVHCRCTSSQDQSNPGNG